MADPFAATHVAGDAGARYSTPSFTPTFHQHHSYASSDTSTSSTRPQSAHAMTQYRPSAGPSSSSQAITDEFGSYTPSELGPSQSVSGARSKPIQSPTMPLPLPIPEPIASTSHAYASSHTHTAQSQPQQQARAANRRSHNPASTLANASPPRAEYLTDEYVLHPSVFAYKQAHPRRPMIGFGPYVLLQTLGEGEFGKVKLGVHTDFGVEVAIKLIRRGSLDDEVRASKVEREIDVLKTLKHPNIVRMFDVIDTEKYIGIVLEYAGGGELFEYILANKYLKERDAQKLFAQLVSGVDYLHKKHIVHRDLKLENLLLDKHRNIIITDFGFANRFDQEQDDLMATSCGSPCYAAPELVVSEGLYVGSAVDIWSCGVILYAMLSGYLPYDDDPQNPDGDNINLLYKYIMSTKLNFPDHMSPLAKSLLQIMLVPLPEHRCTIDQIMAHPWLAGYQDMFTRSIEEHEYVFQEAMYRKSQQAKRELSERKRIQAEAREAKATIHRSQSTMPGAGVTASMLDYSRRREQRHHSAMPTTTTMPEYLNNAGHRTPPLALAPRQAMAPPPLPVPAHAQMVTSTPVVVSPVSLPTPSIPSPVKVSEPHQSESAAPVHTPTDSIDVISSTTSESAPDAPIAVPVADPETRSKPPMSANKNRHTIQVEYDGDASYEKMKESLESKRKRGEASGSTIDEHLAPAMADIRQGGATDIEMESGSSDNEHERTDTTESAPQTTLEAAEVVTPHEDTPPATVILQSVSKAPLVPGTPSRKADTEREVASPSTPRASAFTVVDDIITTPRAKVVTPTPKASMRAAKRHESMPPPAMAPLVASSVPAPKNAELSPTGLPKPPKRDRYRKGMSLDKFGLAKLLGQSSHANDENRSGPPSSGTSAIAVHNARIEKDQMKRSSAMRPNTADSDLVKDKKTRRRTLQQMVNRTNSRDGQSTRLPTIPATPLTIRDLNEPPRTQPSPPVVIGSQGIQPVSTPVPGQSSPSIVTVDALVAQQADAPIQKTASSKAAKKVMDWFRRKSLAKDTLSGLKSAGIKSDSQSSFVRVEGNMRHGPDRMGASAANLAMSSVSSIGRDQEGLSITVTQEAQPESAISPKPAPMNAPRQPLGSAASKTNIQSTSDLLPPSRSHVTPSMPGRSQSHHPSQFTAGPSASMTFVPEKPLTTRPRSGSEDVKMRVHSGLVDQSALSSKAPQEVIAEVLKVLQEMGMDVKRENEYRLRCTRVRRRKAGATTGLGLGSVMSVGSGMSPFTLMSSASTSKTDNRGLPLPMSPSSSLLSGSGLKGMLLRRGSSHSSYHPSQLPRSESEPFGSPSIGSTPNLISTEKLPSHEPLYGEHSVDSGDEVKFVVELCRIKNLPGLYLLNIKRLRGSVWSFKFIYQTVIERTSTLTH
ncbi:hypothetical protein IAR55_002136 [Kwoniella newhampshirensis]|uniref:non-specific serine/threonine protein kinase n=1 Tax=Kwoniella newhampshirensis TaxID=1651941 RepID=A0AAW0Z0W5_9TREE